MEEKQTRLYGALGSMFLHLLIFALMWCFGLSHIIQPKENEGIEVMLGNVEQASGRFAPGEIKPQAQEAVDVSSPRPAVKAQSAPVLTQNNEESTEMLEQKKKQQEQRQMDLLKQQEENRLREQERARQAELQRQQAVKQQKINEINKKMSGAFGSGGNAGSSGTAASGKGFMGSPTGNSTKGAVSGIGGNGSSVSYSLSGRSVSGVLSRPSYSEQVEGKIEVEIVVTPEGKVISADIDIAHSSIASSSMRQAARRAALQTRFNNIDSNENQMGTITYVYRLTR
jgi:TonB family C-terminal domain